MITQGKGEQRQGISTPLRFQRGNLKPGLNGSKGGGAPLTSPSSWWGRRDKTQSRNRDEHAHTHTYHPHELLSLNHQEKLRKEKTHSFKVQNIWFLLGVFNFIRAPPPPAEPHSNSASVLHTEETKHQHGKSGTHKCTITTHSEIELWKVCLLSPRWS